MERFRPFGMTFPSADVRAGRGVRIQLATVAAVGGVPGIPCLGAELATIRDGTALAACPSANLGGCWRGSGGSAVEISFADDGDDLPRYVCFGFGPGAGGGEEA
jgi:hypothetical protein